MLFQSLEEKDELFKQFRELSHGQKLEFWNIKLPVNYFDYCYLEMQDQIEFSEFIFDFPKNEWGKYNQWILINFKKLVTESKHKKDLLDLNELIINFEEKISDKNDSEVRVLLYDEIERIDTSFVELNGGVRSKIGVKFINTIFKANYYSYSRYLKYKKELSYNEVPPNVLFTISLANGVTLAKYLNYLNEKLLKLDNLEVDDLKDTVKRLESEINNRNKKKVSEPIQVLIAHYSGALAFLDDLNIQVNKKANLVSTMLNIGQENAEKYLRGIGNKKSKTYKKEYYEYLIEFFDELGLNEPKKKCEEVLKKMVLESSK